MLENVLKTAEHTGCQVVKDALLSNYTSFKTGGKVSAVISPKTIDAAAKVITSCRDNDVKTIIIGNGSNFLASDNGFSGVVIRLTSVMTEIRYLGEGVIESDAGVTLSRLCRFALANNLSGLEFAYGIPGTVGGAVFMNAGAYGGEMGDVLVRTQHICLADSKLGSFSGDELKLSYRKSAYSDGGYLITKAAFRLNNAPREEIKAKMDELITRRTDKQPLEYPSAGSTFKRPEGNFAGALIEQCGLKGYTIGKAQVSEKHAGFIINLGGATSAEILELIQYVQKTVKEKTGVMLEPEVKILEG